MIFKLTSQKTILFTDFIHSVSNEATQSGNCPSCFKWNDVTPILKISSRSQVENYRPVSILPNLSKLFERLLFEKMYFL